MRILLLPMIYKYKWTGLGLFALKATNAYIRLYECVYVYSWFHTGNYNKHDLLRRARPLRVYRVEDK